MKQLYDELKQSFLWNKYMLECMNLSKQLNLYGFLLEAVEPAYGLEFIKKEYKHIMKTMKHWNN